MTRTTLVATAMLCALLSCARHPSAPRAAAVQQPAPKIDVERIKKEARELGWEPSKVLLRQRAHDDTVHTFESYGALFQAPPPESLDRFYPPSTPSFAYRDEMQRMYGPASAVRQLAHAGKWDEAGKKWKEFVERLRHVRGLVPEWEQYFGPENIFDETMGPVIAQGKSELDAVVVDLLWQELRIRYCERCHTLERIGVIARYHFPSFSAVQGFNPDSNPGNRAKEAEVIPFREYMYKLGGAFYRIGDAIDAGEPLVARAQSERLLWLLQRSPPWCATCHGLEERRYFIDHESLARWSGLAELLARPHVDPAEAKERWQDAARHTCERCHAVHVIPAKLQRVWAIERGEQLPGD